MKVFKILVVLFVAGLMMTACSDKSEKNGQALLPGENVVLARVNGSDITQYEMDLAIKKMFSRETAGLLDDDNRQKILESLVVSRAIAQKAEAELNDKDRAEIAKKVKFYREELLAQKYIAAHSAPLPVNEEMIKAYYDEHPEQFGGKRTRTYEMIMATRELNGTERTDTMKALLKAGDRSDWEQWSRALEKKGRPLAYREGVVSEKLDKRLVSLFDSLEVNQASPVTFINGKLYLVRITKDVRISPQPLDEVRARIQRMLSPIQVKAAIEQVADEVLKTADVVYEKQ